MNRIGIVGGVGPEAGIDIHKKIVHNTIAHKDQDHIPIFHISLGHTIGDRTEYYLDQKLSNPAYAIFDVISVLQKNACTTVGIPCNSAHIPCIRTLIDTLVADAFGSSITLVHIIKEVAEHIVTLGIHKVGLLATKGAVYSRLYHNVLEKYSIEVIAPDNERKISLVHDSVYHEDFGIKTHPTGIPDRAREILYEEAHELSHKHKVQAIIMGCTEIPLAMSQDRVETPLIDPGLLLARALIRESNPDKLLSLR